MFENNIRIKIEDIWLNYSARINSIQKIHNILKSVKDVRIIKS